MCVTVAPDVRIFGGLEGSGRWAMYKKKHRESVRTVDRT